MSRHTPGPWKIVDHNGMICVSAPEGHPHKTLASIGHDERKIHAWRVEEGHYPDTVANAALIASSPELLDALERIKTLAESGVIQRNETGKPQWSLLDELKAITGAAIAKAKGGQP